VAKSRSQIDVLQEEYLPTRAKILEIAASLDRIDRAEGSLQDDARMVNLQEGLRILLDSNSGRAERVQLLFSREYEEQWQEHLGIPGN